MTLGSYNSGKKGSTEEPQIETPNISGKGQYKVDNYEFIVSFQQKGFGIVVEKHRLKSILNDYDLYQKINTAWQFPFSLFVSCVIGILGSKLAWDVNTMTLAQVTGFLYATTLGLFIWTIATGVKAYNSSKNVDVVKDADSIFNKILCNDNMHDE